MLRIDISQGLGLFKETIRGNAKPVLISSDVALDAQMEEPC